MTNTTAHQAAARIREALDDQLRRAGEFAHDDTIIEVKRGDGLALLAERDELAKDAATLREVGAALLFVTRALATEQGIDPETTEFRFAANNEHIATFTLAKCYESADAALTNKD